MDSDENMQHTLLPLEIPLTWQQTINRLCDKTQPRPTIVQICGPANVGKTTFTRLLTNSWLSSLAIGKRESAVAILDLDPNKPEHSPPGQISLVLAREPILSPSFTRPSTTSGQILIRSHAIGIDGSRENTPQYLDAVQNLLECYRSLDGDDSLDIEVNSDFPLIVTCPAWYQGSGMDLNVNLTQALAPSHVVCLGEGPTKAMAALQRAAGSTRLQILQSQPYPTTGTFRTASELREMQLISYFHSEWNNSGPLLWNPTPLTARKPYQVSYGEQGSDFLGVFIFGEVPVMYANMLSTLLNGSLVSLIAIEDDAALDAMELCRGEEDRIPYFAAGDKGYTSPFDPSMSTVIGVALIRSVDSEEQTMQILTPVPPQALAKVPHKRLVLAFGALECPGWAYTEDFYHRDWAKDRLDEGVGKELKSAPWVEYVGEEVRQVSGPAMQAWKSRRFQ
jgi:polynucleotide 5'-hydroxyl-kinase GRC3/NOL9